MLFFDAPQAFGHGIPALRQEGHTARDTGNNQESDHRICGFHVDTCRLNGDVGNAL
jgi:hypothetical protein